MTTTLRQVSARRWRAWVAVAIISAGMATGLTGGESARVLRVAADPNNLPFSNERGEGFENQLVELIARELGARVEYTWWAQRRGFFRNTLKEGNCDVVAGVPHRFDPLLTTAPYYRSSYVFVSRADRELSLATLDDPRMRELLIGVQMVGDDFSNTPPAHALSRRGIIRNVRGFTLYGDYREPNPPARIIDAVVAQDVDVAIAWGPLAGYFAKTASVKLVLTPLPTVDAAGGLPFAFDISVGVRRSEQRLRDEIDAVLAAKTTDIATLLARYGVPLADPRP